jgi:hypothetical protein
MVKGGIWSVASLVLLVGCGGSSTPTALLTVAPSAAQQSLASTPWPSDLFLDDGGHVALSQLPTSTVDLTPALLDDLNTIQDGFSVSTGAYFPVSAEIDPATLDGNVHLYDLADGSDLPILVSFRAVDTPATVYARPQRGTVLLERHRYAYVLTTGVAGPAGALQPSEDLRTLLAPGGAPSGTLGRAFAIYQPLLALLDQGVLPRSQVAAATVFTTHSITSVLTAMRQACAAAPPPKAAVQLVFAKVAQGTNAGRLDDLLGPPKSQLGLDWDYTNMVPVGGAAHDRIGYVIQGTFSTPDFLDTPGAPNSLGVTPSTVDLFDHEADGPTVKGSAIVPFTLVLPDLAHPADYAGLPVVVFQHGLAASRENVMGIAESNAAAGFATIAIDIPFHGARNVSAMDEKHRFSTVPGPDGFAEVGSSLPFIGFFDVNGNRSRGIPGMLPRAIRDAFLQAAIDVQQEVRMVLTDNLSAIKAAEPRLSMLSFRTDRVGYSGESFGSIYGTLAVALEPAIGGAVLDVGGGGVLIDLLLHSNLYGPKVLPFLDGALGTQTGTDNPPDTDFAYNLVQFLLETADAAAYAPYVILHPLPGNAPKHVLQPSAHFDEVVPNEANVGLARALGLSPVSLPQGGAVDLQDWPMAPAPLAAPVAGNLTASGQPITAAFLQFETACHSMLIWPIDQQVADLTQPYPYPQISPVTIMNPTVRLQAIYVGFFRDLFAGRAPTVATGL